MKRVLLTGVSATGKSTVIRELSARGFEAVDTDEGDLSELVEVSADEPTGLEPGTDWVWRADRIQALLSETDADVLFLGGCSPNQGQFYPQFDHVVLLTAPAEVLAHRLATRTTNPYGKRPGEPDRALAQQCAIEPLLRRGADLVLDTREPLERIVAEILRHLGCG